MDCDGEKTVNTQSLPDAESVIVTDSMLVEVYLSHKMVLFGHYLNLRILNLNYIAQFSTTLVQYSSGDPKLKQTMELLRDYFQMQLKLPRKLKVGITTTPMHQLFQNCFGVQVSDSTSATAIQGYIEQLGGRFRH